MHERGGQLRGALPVVFGFVVVERFDHFDNDNFAADNFVVFVVKRCRD